MSKKPLKLKLIQQIQTIRRGSVLTCAKGKAQKFDKSMLELLALVARQEPNGLLVVPYYDTKRVNLWQDLFVWVFSDLYETDLRAFYTETRKLMAMGFELYLNGCKEKLPERITIHNVGSLKGYGATYPALSQQANYNDLKIVPRCNVVEIAATYYVETGKWLDPYWLEEATKDWATTGSIYTAQKSLLMSGGFNFDEPSITRMPDGSKVGFNFLADVETTKDLDF